MKRVIVFFAIFLSFSLMGKGNGRSIGQLVEVQGEVWVIRGKSKPKLVKVNQLLIKGDEVITGPLSSAKILMNDDTVFDIYEAGQFHLKAYREAKKSKKEVKLGAPSSNKVYRLSTGSLKGIFPSNKFKNNPVVLESPDVEVKITGTVLYGQVNSKNGEIQTSVLLTKGKAFIRPTLSNQFKPRQLVKGEIVTTDFASKLGHSISATRLQPEQFKKFTEKRTKESQKFRKSILSGKRKFALSPQLKKFYRQNTTSTTREKNFNQGRIAKMVGQSSNRAMERKRSKKKQKFKKINKLPKCTTKPVCVQTGPKRVLNSSGNYVWTTGCIKFTIQRLPKGCRP